MKSNNIEFESALTAEDKKGANVPVETIDAGAKLFRVVADQMPIISYSKSQGQLVDITYSIDSTVLNVTAQDGLTTAIYTIRREDPNVATSGQIKEFKKNGAEWGAIGGSNYTTTEAKPEGIITFERKDAKDSIVYIQAPDKQEWQVYGSEDHTYMLNYPAALSNNAKLAALLVNGAPYSEYSQSQTDYTIDSDTMLILNAGAAHRDHSGSAKRRRSGIYDNGYRCRRHDENRLSYYR